MAISISCPQCGSDNVQSFQILNAQGTSVINTTTRSSGIGIIGGSVGVAGGSSTTSGVQQTAIGQMTAPPVTKKYMLKGLITLVFAGIAVSAPFSGGGFGGFIICLAIAAIFGYFCWKNLKWNANVYPNLVAQWQNSFLCNKCGTAFDRRYSTSSLHEVAVTTE